jgi:hypothetical protein
MKRQLTFDEKFDLPYWRDQENDLWGLDCEFIELENPKNWQSKIKTTSEKEEMSRRSQEQSGDSGREQPADVEQDDVRLEV